MGSKVCWCTTRFSFRSCFSWPTSMILLKAFHQLLNFLLMTHHCFLLSITLMNLQIKWIWIYKRYHSGFNIGRCPSTLTSQSKPRKLFFSKKNVNASHPILYFNRTPVIHCSQQKHLGVYLDKKLSFYQHIKEIITKAKESVLSKSWIMFFLGKLY